MFLITLIHLQFSASSVTLSIKSASSVTLSRVNSFQPTSSRINFVLELCRNCKMTKIINGYMLVWKVLAIQHHQSYLQHHRYLLTGNDNQNFQTISYCTKYCNDTLRFISKLEQDEMLVIITHFVYYAISIFQLANGMKIALIYNFLCH